MDESSLDPRLRDSGEEKSIVVNSGGVGVGGSGGSSSGGSSINNHDTGSGTGTGTGTGTGGDRNADDTSITSIAPKPPPQNYHQPSSHLSHSSHSSQPPQHPPHHPQETHQHSHSNAPLSTPTSTRTSHVPPSAAAAGIHNSITANPNPAASSDTIESQYHATSTGGGTGGSHPFTPQTPNTPNAGYDGGDGTPQDPNDPKRPRACEACRGLKVKCEPDPANPDGPCKRCAKAGRNCVVTQPTRKRQKKTDSRVAELEKKIDALTASLQATRGGGPGPSHAGNANGNVNSHHHGQQPHAASADSQNGFARPPPFGSAPNPWAAPPPQDSSSGYGGASLERSALATPTNNAAGGHKRKFSDTQPCPDLQSSPASQRAQGYSGAPETFDPVGKGLITAEMAETLLQRYNKEMAPHLPAVVFPPNLTAASLRKSRPYLFLAVMATATSEMAHVQRQLANEVVHLIADRIVIRGEKSMELVQLLLLTVIWYYPPEHFEELKFYQFVHMAAVLAIDIGLGKKRNPPKSRLFPAGFRDNPVRRAPLPDPTTIEARRTWLASYFLASNVAMALHRTNLVRWTPFMTECMDILESSPEAAPTDRYLCNLVWTHRLAEEVGIQFSMDDPSVSVSISEPKVQYALRSFDRDMVKYRDSIPKEDKQPSLLLSFNVLSLYMHEVALHVDKTDDLRPPHSTEGLGDPIPGLSESLTTAHISALSSCLTAIDGIFEVFLSMDVRSIRCLPVFNFVRVAYATVVLIKMYFSAKSPDSDLGKVIDKDNMKVEEYLEKLLDKFRAVADVDKSRPAAKFMLVLAMLRGWFQKQGEIQSQGQAQGQDQAQKQTAQPSPRGNERAASKPDGTTATTTTGSGPGAGAPPPPPPSGGPQKQSEYNPANTPLQLLSEIATGNDPSSRAKQQNGGAHPPPPPPMGSMPSYQQPPFAPAPLGQQHQHQQHPPPSMYNGSPDVVMGGQQQPQPQQPQQPMPTPWLSQGWTDFDFDDPGDGFQQAMGLTLQGLGSGPGYTDWESTMRQVVHGGGGIGNLQDWTGISNFYNE